MRGGRARILAALLCCWGVVRAEDPPPVFVLTQELGPATAAPETPKGEFTLPLTVGYVKGLTLGIGCGWRFPDGTELSGSVIANVRKGESGVATGPYDYDFDHRWPVVDVSVPFKTKSETVYGAVLTITPPIGRKQP